MHHNQVSFFVREIEPPNRGGAGGTVSRTASFYARLGLPEPTSPEPASARARAGFRYIVSGDRQRYLHDLARLRRAPQVRSATRRTPRARVVRRAAARAAAKAGTSDSEGDGEPRYERVAVATVDPAGRHVVVSLAADPRLTAADQLVRLARLAVGHSPEAAALVLGDGASWQTVAAGVTGVTGGAA